MITFKETSLAERIILKPFIEKQSKGGIYIARDERSQAINTDQGEIYMIGPAAWYDLPIKPDIKPGDKVYYSKYGAKVIKPEGSEEYFIICNDKDILLAYEGTNELEHSDE
jgi:chaperonin GroES